MHNTPWSSSNRVGKRLHALHVIPLIADIQTRSFMPAREFVHGSRLAPLSTGRPGIWQQGQRTT